MLVSHACSLPFAFFMSGRNANVTSIRPNVLTSITSRKSLVCNHSRGPLATPGIPALFTRPHKPARKYHTGGAIWGRRLSGPIKLQGNFTQRQLHEGECYHTPWIQTKISHQRSYMRENVITPLKPAISHRGVKWRKMLSGPINL